MLQQHLYDCSPSTVNLFKVMLHKLMTGEVRVGELRLSGFAVSGGGLLDVALSEPWKTN